MFFGTFWEHHTCHYICHTLIIKHLNTILCYLEEIDKMVKDAYTKRYRANCNERKAIFLVEQEIESWNK